LSASPDLPSASRPSQHLRNFSAFFQNLVLKKCWKGAEMLGFQICTFPLVLNASLKTRFILFVVGSFDKWRVWTRFQACV
jgi:hypothetical protein